MLPELRVAVWGPSFPSRLLPPSPRLMLPDTPLCPQQSLCSASTTVEFPRRPCCPELNTKGHLLLACKVSPAALASSHTLLPACPCPGTPGPGPYLYPTLRAHGRRLSGTCWLDEGREEGRPGPPSGSASPRDLCCRDSPAGGGLGLHQSLSPPATRGPRCVPEVLRGLSSSPPEQG